MKVRIVAIAAALGLSATTAFALTHRTAGPGGATRTSNAIERIGSAFADFYGSLPPGAPVGP